jgi:hypothetical protein
MQVLLINFEPFCLFVICMLKVKSRDADEICEILHFYLSNHHLIVRFNGN